MGPQEPPGLEISARATLASVATERESSIKPFMVSVVALLTNFWWLGWLGCDRNELHHGNHVRRISVKSPSRPGVPWLSST